MREALQEALQIYDTEFEEAGDKSPFPPANGLAAAGPEQIVDALNSRISTAVGNMTGWWTLFAGVLAKIKAFGGGGSPDKSA